MHAAASTAYPEIVRFLLEHLDSEVAVAAITVTKQGSSVLEAALRVGTGFSSYTPWDSSRRGHIASTVCAILEHVAGSAASVNLLHGMVNDGRRDMTPLLYHLSEARHGPANGDDSNKRWCCANTLQVLLDFGSNTIARYGRGGRYDVLDAVTSSGSYGCRGCSEVLIAHVGYKRAKKFLDRPRELQKRSGVRAGLHEWFAELVETQRLSELRLQG